LVFFALQKQLYADLDQAALIPSIALVGDHIFSRAGDSAVQVPVLFPTFMDDFAICLTAESSGQLLLNIVEAARLTKHASNIFGLEINFAQAKTETIVHLCGLGTTEVQQALAHLEAADSDERSLHPVPLLPIDETSAIRVVQEYKHLGMIAQSLKTSSRELAARCSAGHAASAALYHAVFAKQSLPSAARLQVATACVDSRVLFAAGTWNTLTLKQMAKLEAALNRPLRPIAGVRFIPGQSVPSMRALRSRLGVASAEAKLTAARLRYAQRASCHGPSYLRALLQGAGARQWRQELIIAMRLMKAMLATKLAEFPDPRCSPHFWEDWWTRWPAQWRALVALFLKQTVTRPADFAFSVQELRGQQPESDERDAPALDGWMCMICPTSPTFATHAAFLHHQNHSHGRKREGRFFCLGSVCPACGIDFRHRLRALEHLYRGARACVQAVADGSLHRFSDAEVAAADLADQQYRSRCSKQGRSALQGPPALRHRGG